MADQIKNDEKQQCLINHLCFIGNENKNLGKLNKSGLHLNENGTKWLVNNFCFSMIKWYETICLDRPTTTAEVFFIESGKQKFMFWFFYRQYWQTYNYLV